MHLFENQDGGRPQSDEDDGWEDQEEDREDQLHANFAGAFLSGLPEPDAQVFGVRAQGGSETGAEAVGVREQVDELSELEIRVSLGESANRIEPAVGGAKFERK